MRRDGVGAAERNLLKPFALPTKSAQSQVMDPALSRQPVFGARDVAIIVMMNLFWGLNIIAVKESVDHIAPLTAGLLRQVMVFAICAPALRIVPGRMVALTLLGILTGGLFYLVINLSVALATNVSALAIGSQLGVPFALILGVMFLGERIHWPRLVGIMLSLAGVVVLVFDPAAAGEIPALALTALASFIWAVGSLLQRQLRGVAVLTIYAWIGLWGMVVVGFAAWWFEPRTVGTIGELRLAPLGWVAFSAIGSTLGGHGAMAWLLQRHPVAMVTPMTLAAPVISVFTAAWYFGTPVTVVMLIGGSMAMAGVAIVTIRSARAEQRA